MNFQLLYLTKRFNSISPRRRSRSPPRHRRRSPLPRRDVAGGGGGGGPKEFHGTRVSTVCI